jgi:hypothetical protein
MSTRCKEPAIGTSGERSHLPTPEILIQAVTPHMSGRAERADGRRAGEQTGCLVPPQGQVAERVRVREIEYAVDVNRQAEMTASNGPGLCTFRMNWLSRGTGGLLMPGPRA